MHHTALLLQLASTLFMVGLIWFVQVVHYPLLELVGSGFTLYERMHANRTGWVVGLPMCLELATAVWIAFLPSTTLPAWSRWLGLGLVGIVWASTALLQVPAHGRLAEGFDAAVHARLVATNWLRTFAWTARGALVLWWVTLSWKS
jgi:hypothetical protein